MEEKCEKRTQLVEAHLKNVNGERDIAAAILDIDSIDKLTALYAKGELSAHDVTRSYIRRYDRKRRKKKALATPHLY